MPRLPATDLAAGMARNWWVLLLRGIVAIVFAVLTWMQPAISLAALVLVFGIYVLADGILGIWAAFSGRQEHRHWWVLLLWGLVSVAVGVLTFINPGITGLVLLMYIAAWAVITGVLQIVAAIRLRKEIQGEWLMGLSGLLSIVFGGLLVARPGAGALAVAWIIAAYAFIFGVLLVMLAFKVRKLNG
ncbi:HdeD family acid-resistance protein [Ottowia sp. GY511]|uniref:HdeD family acid-resistance protein n=1 Tax=Ottowia flava TaxID=2675430 RepID=A0ABW4KPD3_9BURK|nr:HdeD family acid-resistance protein [Ottowia sp. GY511]TXK27833.1 HdeD family acid-resistance protein [Ottowia sp. GY511]